MLNRVVKISGGVVLGATMFVLLVAAVSTSKNAVLRDVQVRIDYQGENFFVDQEEIRESVLDMGIYKDSSLLTEIDPGVIEHMLSNNPFVENAEVYSELNGVLHIDIAARNPILRVYDNVGQSVYIDRLGMIMPLSNKFSSRTPIANGHIFLPVGQFVGHNVNELLEKSSHPDADILMQLFEVASKTAQSELWSAQFNQFYVNKDREIEMIPRVGDHRILLGTTLDLDKKLNKLEKFYVRGLNKTGWNEYKIINLKFANQVVCTKS